VRRIALGAAAALALLVPATAGAAAPRADFHAVESQLMCDTCNVGLPIAESARADQERAEIRRLIAEGKTEQQILDIFRTEYGDNVLADPKGGGTAVASWAVPAGILLAAAIAILLLLPRWRRRKRDGGDDDAPPPPALSADDEQRLERDLALYDR
jgi:cytochrome c-type biogenesis protein CcmH/NrfF